MVLSLMAIEHMDKSLAQTLRNDGWTVELLATTTQKALIRYQGVGRVKAARIISAARQLVNEEIFVECGVPVPEKDEDIGTWLERHWTYLVRGEIKPEPMQRSVRVQRIYDSQRSGA